MNIKYSRLFNSMILLCCFGLSGCLSMNIEVPTNKATKQQNNKTTKQQNNKTTIPKWLNPFTFDHEDKIGDTLHDVTFDIIFSSPNGGELSINNCFEVFPLGEIEIVQREFSRWEWLKSNCLGASWYYRSPDVAISYWDNMFDFDLLKTFPATAVPYLGGQGLNKRNGNLSEKELSLTLIESNNNNIKISINNMVIDYVVIARADFNRDGYQDMFIRLDWYMENSFGEGFDWIVLTKTSPHKAPMMLWRK